MTVPTELRPRRYRLDVDADAGRPLSLWVYDVGLACCAVEFLAAAVGVGSVEGDREQLGAVPMTTAAADAQVLLVSGTVTAKLAPAVQRLYEQLPHPKHVISFGACANSGGPYWDSYCVTPGVGTLLPVDVHVPGCPPRPEALLDALRQLEQR
ncbi:MAG TPA: NADH-quinone oxidoreductase subunit NuoB [Mycobacteriales bacterium]|nr:NADH-quinone oxidoreductase subunit NuoB [Mycobacteriales bacterium]